MPDDVKVSGLFAAALNSEPLPVVTPAATSSCCGPKPAAAAEDAPAASSCCGPKPAAAAAPKAKKSCCG